MSPKRACRQFHTVRAVLTFLKCPSAIAGWCYCCRVLLRWTRSLCNPIVRSLSHLGDRQLHSFSSCSPHLVGLGLPTVPHSFYIPTSRTCLHILSFEGPLCLNYKVRLIANVLRMRVSLGSLKGSRSSHSLSKRACLLYTSQVSSCRQCLEKGHS